MTEVKRVIHVVSDMHRGGVETMLINLYRNIDRSKLQFDFICHYRKDEKGSKNHIADYYEEIESLGGRIFKIPSLGSCNPIEYINNMKNILKNNGPFEAIHVHTNKQAGFALIAAKLANVKKRIVHSHTAKWDELNKYYMKFLKSLIKYGANIYCACGKDSAENAFGYNKKNVFLLNNSIEVEKYSYVNEEEIKKIKNELQINDDETIIGHVGRFDPSKNHEFILKLAENLKKKGRKFLVLLVGTGPIEGEISNKISKLNLSNEVKMLGVRKDINVLMNLFDVFLLPSFFEGLPLVAIEAQAAGTKCIVSDGVTKEIDMGLGLVKHLPIKGNCLDLWEKEIFNKDIVSLDKDYVLTQLKLKGYNVKSNIEKLYEIYGV
ncbi:TPA: glycosyltransferase [Clostridium perfringens]|uniref:glycosyltransferase n=1 Tax=Clostridium perfringens TaxID=1502 RepID=UPI0024696844|nr:glycosyltransferase [Clostridium perfringens]MDH5086789.1 putative glycosyltransferase EpsF [Clostridium perfringens]MDK0767710.1 glycosyltransferase [Clostridium perfringens]MDK0770357.1 glycosyltransferase [Clostridium perfringens]MDK0775503.1 glycosyltransferase [Clostridium perfringens]MDM0995603.1 glycosyltransferase [Clostridium perfringens]